MHGHDFADLLGSPDTRFDRGFHRRHVAAHNGRYIAAAGLLVTDEFDLGRFDHRIAGLNHCRKTFAFDHA
jgi:hypothetical protein